MRVLRDVVVDRLDSNELLAVSQTPGIAGEEMSLDLVGGGTSMELRVRVIESRPVIIDGTVRHRVRLALVHPVVATRIEGTVPPLDVAVNAGLEAI